MFFKPFLLQNILLAQHQFRDPGGKITVDRKLRSSWQWKEAQKLAITMEKLRSIISLVPGLRQQCRSICLVYKETYIIAAEDDDGDQMSDPGENEETNDKELDEQEPENQHTSISIPSSSWLSSMYGLLNYITDFQLHCDNLPRSPDFTLALSSFQNLTKFRVTGTVKYFSIFQHIATLPTNSTLQTLDMSDAISNQWYLHVKEVNESTQMLQASHGAPYLA
ncbi:hypothetical protein FLONG3_6052 [Fusarium longipes]|uniref:Uncharacterized protein n=1 Tax=Fusarium longipes TaxID=694270 RepID=A0A395SPV3_9HYPO|nr:hypothetical protein FLONG3_6052 [Fusarium longipes]